MSTDSYRLGVDAEICVSVPGKSADEAIAKFREFLRDHVGCEEGISLSLHHDDFDLDSRLYFGKEIYVNDVEEGEWGLNFGILSKYGFNQLPDPFDESKKMYQRRFQKTANDDSDSSELAIFAGGSVAVHDEGYDFRALDGNYVALPGLIENEADLRQILMIFGQLEDEPCPSPP